MREKHVTRDIDMEIVPLASYSETNFQVPSDILLESDEYNGAPIFETQTTSHIIRTFQFPTRSYSVATNREIRNRIQYNRNCVQSVLNIPSPVMDTSFYFAPNSNLLIGYVPIYTPCFCCAYFQSVNPFESLPYTGFLPFCDYHSSLPTCYLPYDQTFQPTFPVFYYPTLPLLFNPGPYDSTSFYFQPTNPGQNDQHLIASEDLLELYNQGSSLTPCTFQQMIPF